MLNSKCSKHFIGHSLYLLKKTFSKKVQNNNKILIWRIIQFKITVPLHIKKCYNTNYIKQQ